MSMGRGGLFGYPKLDDAESIMFPASQRGLFGGVPTQMVAPQEQQEGKPKFFGRGGTGRAIAGSIGDALLQMNGMQPIYAPTVEAQRDERAKMQMMQAKRQQEWDDWVAQQQYKRENPEPVNNDTVNDYGFIKQRLGEEAADNYLRNLGDPYVTTPLPGNRYYAGPRSGMGAALGGGAEPADVPTVSDEASYNAIPAGAQYRTPEGKLKVKGGAASNGGGPFPR
jgi:hypothetical protein